MKLPSLESFEFTTSVWKESLLPDSEFRTKMDYYNFLKKEDENGSFDWCEGIDVNVSNNRIKKLLIGYTLPDILDVSKKIVFSRYKMWQFFEDLVGEILREALHQTEECTLIHVDRWPGFRGLDYVIVNSEREDSWTAGVQCKKYIGNRIPISRVEEYGRWTTGPSSANLIKKASELRKKYPKKKIVLIAFNAYRVNKEEETRFQKLKKDSEWDSVVVMDKSKYFTNGGYVYKLDLRELNRIIALC